VPEATEAAGAGRDLIAVADNCLGQEKTRQAILTTVNVVDSHTTLTQLSCIYSYAYTHVLLDFDMTS